MWALAIVDERPETGTEVVLCRDHLGIKPMYLAEADGRLLFASEIKALLACSGLVPEPDEQRLTEYLLRGLHDHDERTFFRGVRQVPPATATVISTGSGGRSEQNECYWTPRLSTGATGDPGRVPRRVQPGG